MSDNQKTIPNEVAGFLIGTLPSFARHPEFREFFDLLANLKPSQVEGVLKLVEADPAIEGKETVRELIKHSVNDPENPRMMVRMIDLYANANKEGSERLEECTC